MDGIWDGQPMRRLVFARIEDLGGGGLEGLIGVGRWCISVVHCSGVKCCGSSLFRV